MLSRFSFCLLFLLITQWKCRPGGGKIRPSENHLTQRNFNQSRHSGSLVTPPHWIKCLLCFLFFFFPLKIYLCVWLVDTAEGVQLWQPPQTDLHRGGHTEYFPCCEACKSQSLRRLPLLPEWAGQSAARWCSHVSSSDGVKHKTFYF